MQVGQRVGPFDIEKQLGSGAMGSVYRARYRKTGDRVAIKVMLAGLGGNETALARFQREASVLKQLHHPNIVRFYAAGDFEGAPFYAMEYIQGEPLDRLLERGGRLTWEKVVELGKQVCAALKHAHDQGIVHRDLKPSNLMLLPDGTLKLTDFGIAKDLDVTQLTSANCTVGTAAYMSPEQCKGERNLTHKSDLYSLGVVLYELLVGRKPFLAETPMDMFLQHVQGTFERPARIVLEIPVWLDNIVCQLLEKKPEHRPFDAAIVADALDKVAEKVANQQSAGVERVKSRVGERSMRETKIDATDRKAAATLRTGFGRGRKKRRARPFYTRVWFQLIAISALLLAVGAVFYQAFRSPSAGDLYQKIEQVMKSGDFDAKREARNSLIKDYLSAYGTGDDEHTAQVRSWAEEIDVRTLESTRLKRRNLAAFDKGEGIFRTALEREEAGELSEARKIWQELEVLEDPESDDIHAYHLLARERIRAIDQAVAKEKELDDLAKQMRSAESQADSEEQLERVATDALRYELFGDLGMARLRWAQLRASTEKRWDKHSWTLVAYKRFQPLKDKKLDDEERVQLVKTKLDEATVIATERQREARALLKEIVALYREDHSKELENLVDQARKKYEELMRGEGH
jgi:eukaryotic-like serine/threonine-protein kinase